MRENRVGEGRSVERLSDFFEALSRVTGGWLLIVLLLGTGAFLSVRTRFVQFRRFGAAMRHTLGRAFRRQTAGAGEVTPFQAMTTALAGTVGTGNMAGVAAAICLGGPGAVFWMWVAALLGMATKYCEITLSLRYRVRDGQGGWDGGPMYYITRGLGEKWKWLAALFCVFGSLAAFGIGNIAQINAITAAAGTAVASFGGHAAAVELFGRSVPLSNLIVGALAAVFAAAVLWGGTRRVGAVTETLVPFMALVYILAALAVILGNAGRVGEALRMIFTGAFDPVAVTGGGTGIAVSRAVRMGCDRGLFSNEAGMGSAPIAHAAAAETDPARQGLFGIFEVFMDTIVICTLTALALLCGLDGELPWGDPAAGGEMLATAFASVFGGRVGSAFIAAALALFALSTLLSWAYYGGRCFEFLFGAGAARPYNAVFVAVILAGALMEPGLAWTVSAVLNNLMAYPNLVALLALSGTLGKCCWH